MMSTDPLQPAFEFEQTTTVSIRYHVPRDALTVHAVVPVKELGQAKTRLAGALSPTERQRLMLAMVHCVLNTLRTVVERDILRDLHPFHLRAVWVVTRDPVIERLLPEYNVRLLPDTTNSLNAALTLAATTVQRAGADALLVVPADVPLLTLADVDGLLGSLLAKDDVSGVPKQPRCVLAPNEDASGTNALALTLPSPLPFLFGANSFEQHRGAAQRLGVAVRVYRSSTLALDVDTPTDLARSNINLRRERNAVYGNYWICCGT